MANNYDQNQSNIPIIQTEYEKRARIRKAKRKSNFSIINTDCLQDPRLSMNCLAVITYLMSLPEDWEISVSHLAKRFFCSKDKVYFTINELIGLGYMLRYQERNEDGVFGTWITEATDDPKLLKSAALPENSRVQPHKEKPDPVKAGSGKKRHNKELRNNKILKNNKQSPTPVQPKPELQETFHQVDPNVVVSLMENVKEWAVKLVTIQNWVKQYGVEYVTEKIEYTKVNAKKNPGGFLRQAIANNWKKHYEPKSEVKLAVEVVYPSHSENLAWYASLSDEEKRKCYGHAISKHAHFENMLKADGIDFISTAFLKTDWFAMLMELIGRAK